MTALQEHNAGQSAIVALSQLHFDMKHNSRDGQDEPALQELVKSIDAIGLITPLTVRKSSGNLYLVIDGHRRLEALRRLYGQNAEEYHVPVLVREVDNADAVVLSLAANIVRLPLHPADQYKAFAKMLDEGLEREEIARRFNLDLKAVERVLALGKVIPAALSLYRDGQIDAETIKLFASCSQERQAEVWTKAYQNDQLSKWQVRQLLSDNTILGSSRIAELATEAAYEAAGGRIERSLFDNETRWLDPQLATELADKAFAAQIEKIKADGWAFVQREEDMPPQWLSWQRLRPEESYAKEDREALESAQAEIDLLGDKDEDDWSEEDHERWDQLEAKISEIRDSKVILLYTDEQKARSGVVICKDYVLRYGVIKPEKVKLPEAGETPAKPEKKSWPQTVIDDIESIGTVAAQLAILREPDMADCMLLAAMYQDTIREPVARLVAINSADKFHDVNRNADKSIQNAIKSAGLKGSKFWSVVEQIQKLDAKARATLRAALVARALKKCRGDILKDTLEQLETVNVLEVWKPDARFFERLNTQQLIEIAKELGHPLKPEIKKQDAVKMVATWAAAANWLPKVLSRQNPVRQPAKQKPKKKAA